MSLIPDVFYILDYDTSSSKISRLSWSFSSFFSRPSQSSPILLASRFSRLRYDRYIPWWWIHSCTSLSGYPDPMWLSVRSCVHPQKWHWQERQIHTQNEYRFMSEQIAGPSRVKETQGSQLATWKNGAKLRVSVGFSCCKVGHLVAVAARLALANGSPGYPQYLPPWPPNSYSHYTSTVVADDRNWLTSPVWVILSTCLLSVSPVVDALWWVLAYDTKVFLIFTCSHMSITMPLPQPSLFPAFQSFSF